jgi:TM2 domain-containing membrane protein YozV
MSTEPDTTPASQPAPPSGNKSEKKLIAGLLGVLGFLYGGFGIHKFYLGYTKEGVIQLLLCFACGIGTIIGIIEGVIYLTKTDEEFDEIYVKGNRPWF